MSDDGPTKQLPRQSRCLVGDYGSTASAETLKRQSVEVAPPAADGETGVYRHALYADKLVSVIPTCPSATTLHEVFESVSKRVPDNWCLGERERLEDGTRGEFVWHTYKEVVKRRDEFGAGLATLGIKSGTHVGMYSVNTLEWLLTDITSHAYNFTLVPLYDTLGVQQAEYIARHASLFCIVCTADKLEKVYELCRMDDMMLKVVVVMNDEGIEDTDKQSMEDIGVAVHYFKDVEKMGREALADVSKADLVKHTPPTKDDVFTIMYTSGSTGTPKGVMLQQTSLMADVAGVTCIDVVDPLLPPMIHLCYLPLAHIYERLNVWIHFATGGCVGVFGGDMLKLLDDIQTLRPTHIVGVPRVFDRIRTKLTRTIEASPVKALLFKWGYAAKSNALQNGYTTPFWNWLLFSKIKEKLGGRARFLVSASAALDPSLQEFMAICFDTPCMQGYGMTETTGASLGQFVNDLVGSDVPEMGYHVTDKPNPRGELLMRGPIVFKGYYKNPEATNETLDKNGWLHSGDIARLEDTGAVSIIDRKKSILKLSQGEYIASEYLEVLYARSKYIMQVYVSGGPYANFLVAVVVPDPEALLPYLEEQMGPGAPKTIEQACKLDSVKEMLLEEMKTQGVAGKLKGFEFVKNIHVEPEPFSVENDMLTPTFKLRRANAKKKYDGVCQQLTDEFEASRTKGSGSQGGKRQVDEARI